MTKTNISLSDSIQNFEHFLSVLSEASYLETIKILQEKTATAVSAGDNGSRGRIYVKILMQDIRYLITEKIGSFINVDNELEINHSGSVLSMNLCGNEIVENGHFQMFLAEYTNYNKLYSILIELSSRVVPSKSVLLDRMNNNACRNFGSITESFTLDATTIANIDKNTPYKTVTEQLFGAVEVAGVLKAFVEEQLPTATAKIRVSKSQVFLTLKIDINAAEVIVTQSSDITKHLDKKIMS